MFVFDRECALLLWVPRMKNRLYTLQITVGAPVCLLSKTSKAAWLWHGRYGHLNFRALRELGAKVTVTGMPTIDRIDQFCDGYALGR